MAGRFIKLYDKILNWEWYHDVNTFRLFIHLLLKANYKDVTFQGQVIKRGQYVTSLTSLAANTGLSVRQVRVSLDKLQMTGEVTSRSTTRYRVITVIKYDEYQSSDKQNDKQMTNNMSGKWQTNDKQDDKQHGRQMSSEMTTCIDNIESKNYRTIEYSPMESKRTAKRFIPPTREELEIFCLENGLTIDIDRFMDYYESKGWFVGKSPMKNWQATARNWARREHEQQNREPLKRDQKKVVTAQNYDQRDYQDVQDEIMRAQNERIMKRLAEMKANGE